MDSNDVREIELQVRDELLGGAVRKVVDDTIDIIDMIHNDPIGDIIDLYDLMYLLTEAVKNVKSELDKRVLAEGGRYKTAWSTDIYIGKKVTKKAKFNEVMDLLSVPYDMRTLFSTNCFKQSQVSKQLGEEYVDVKESDKVEVKVLTDKTKELLEKNK